MIISAVYLIVLAVTLVFGFLAQTNPKSRITRAGTLRTQPDPVFAFVIAATLIIVAGLRYREYTLTLKPGDRVFVYTDGVPEATDPQNQLFGTERMISALNRNTFADPEDTLRGVEREVNRFVGGAEQFDDMTMLYLEYKGTEKA